MGELHQWEWWDARHYSCVLPQGAAPGVEVSMVGSIADAKVRQEADGGCGDASKGPQGLKEGVV